MSKEQIGEMHQKSIDAAMKLTQMSLENSKRIMELQVETARTLFEESVKNARALTETKDPQAALALRTQFAQETSSKMMEAMRQMADITAEAQAEFNRMLGQQMAGSSQEMMENFKKMMSVSGYARPAARTPSPPCRRPSATPRTPSSRSPRPPPPPSTTWAARPARARA